ncbi:hypothetical protein HYT23_06455 [Candidatus Pacearchaeota archaeon]|nr:hypothetical protein [Candidatus Pacearchaeota archaeon]
MREDLGLPNLLKTAKVYFVEKDGQFYVFKAQHRGAPEMDIRMLAKK